jgi:hypothetical protein
MSITAIFQLVALALDAVMKVESMYKEAKSGPIKKETAVQIFTDGMSIARAAGAPISNDLQENLTPMVPDIIEHAVTIAKTMGLFPNPATEQGY